MLKSVQEVERGNLVIDKQIVHSTDETGKLATAFDSMRNTLRKLVGEVSRTGQTVTEYAEALQTITTVHHWNGKQHSSYRLLK